MKSMTLILAGLAVIALAGHAQAEDLRKAKKAQGAASSTDPGQSGAERVNVDTIKEKYWARGDESEIGVVQNRLYSKERKWELGVFVGNLDSTPFLTVRNAGASLGYHFSEYWSLTAVGWKSFSKSSEAADYFYRERQGLTNTNPPRSYFGLEGAFSPIYGKLSLVGKKIIYYDLHLLAGLGVTDTEAGKYATPHTGIGQQIYLNQWSSLRIDYRIMYYKDRPLEKVLPSTYGQPTTERSVITHAITVGVTFLFGGPKKQQTEEPTEVKTPEQPVAPTATAEPEKSPDDKAPEKKSKKKKKDHE